MTLRTSPTTEVRPKSALKCGFVNHSNSNSRDSNKGVPTCRTFNSNFSIPQVNKMSGSDIKLPRFNGNGLEDPEQHWFLCEVVCIVRQVLDEAIKKAQMITTFRDHALDWYMKFYVVPVGVPQKSLDQIQIGLIEEFKKPKSESQ